MKDQDMIILNYIYLFYMKLLQETLQNYNESLTRISSVAKRILIRNQHFLGIMNKRSMGNIAPISTT